MGIFERDTTAQQPPALFKFASVSGRGDKKADSGNQGSSGGFYPKPRKRILSGPKCHDAGYSASARIQQRSDHGH